MSKSFTSATKNIQDLITLYDTLDSLPSRGQWRFVPNYDSRDTCAFVFSHPSRDASERYNSLNGLSGVLYKAGVKNAIQARDGIVTDVVIASEYANLARKLFARYQENGKNMAQTDELQLEQEWLRQRQK